ncbi:unnamed protein product, partial [Candidula unifasciata]
LCSTVADLCGTPCFDNLKFQVFFGHLYGRLRYTEGRRPVTYVFLSYLVLLTNITRLVAATTNLYAMYRGDYTHIPSPATQSAVALCTASIEYAGFQVAYIIWGFAAVAFVLIIICIVLAILVTLLLKGIDEWLVKLLLSWWPGLVLAIAIFVLQFLLSKYVFLQNNGEHLRLDNRRFYFVFAYFMFFYNIFLGIFSCVMRIFKAVAVGLIFLARLDNSTLPRKFEFFDPGFTAYQGYIHMEAAHTHPVAIIFIRILTALSRERNKNTIAEKQFEAFNLAVSVDGDEAIKECNYHCKSSIIRAVISICCSCCCKLWPFQNLLSFILQVRIYRKGFIQSIRMARLEGIRIPISDKPITDFDLVKAQRERNKLREEEAMRDYAAPNPHNGVVAIRSMLGSKKKLKITNELNKNGSRKCNMFRKLKNRSGCQNLAVPENGLQELNDYTLQLYIKHDFV